MLTGKLWPAEEAKALGIVDELVEPDAVMPHSEELMKKWLSSTFAQAVANTKRETRKNLLAALAEQKRTCGDWIRLWYGSETQRALAMFKANLNKKKN